jgi:hypothetical protein
VLVTNQFHREWPNTISSIVRVILSLGDNTYQELEADHIYGTAHLISEVPSTSKNSIRQIVKSHIDLKIWNTMYYIMEVLNEVLAGGRKWLLQHK